MKPQRFTIHVSERVLADLRRRLSKTRWPDEVAGANWDYGANLAYMKELAEYWQNQFDWRAQESRLNQFAHFKTEIDGFGLHFIHERGQGPNPLPLLLLHGWPDSFFRFYKLIPMLTDPAHFGGDPADSFDVIAPSLAGFGFSDKPKHRGWDHYNQTSTDIYTRLMTDVLGYTRFGAHGGDTGSPIAEAIARAHPESVAGIHLTDIGYDKVMQLDPSTFSDTERAYAQFLEQWSFAEGAYMMVQGTKPQSLAYALNDSPTGLAAWIVEKFRTWSDSDGDVEKRFTKDELLTNITIYWATETISATMRGYYEGFHAQSGNWGKPQGPQQLDVPVGLALFPKDAPAPREMAERFFNVQRYTEMPRGGHFAALEEPELLAEDLRAFFRRFRRA
jgi:microsomal epoxide hydrolase